MTIKWVKSDPLVMNGEPFCYGTRLTVRNLLGATAWDPGIRSGTGDYYPTRQPLEGRNLWLTADYRF